MATVKEIQEAIRSLPKNEYRQLMLWFAEHDWEQWGREIEGDSTSGKLDHIAGQTGAGKRHGISTVGN